MQRKHEPPTTIYADYQATTPVDPRVAERMAPYWGESYGNPHSTEHVVGVAARLIRSEGQLHRSRA